MQNKYKNIHDWICWQLYPAGELLSVHDSANHYHITAHDAMVLASAASSLTRKLSKTYLSGDALKKNIPTSYGIFTSASSTQLNAWSIPAIAMPVMPTMPTSKEMPIHTLWSWYEKVDPTTKPPVYDE